MQKKILISSIVIAIVGFMAFGFISKKPVKVNNIASLTTSIKKGNPVVNFSDINFSNPIPVKENINLFYAVSGSSNRPITMTKLKEAKLLRDLIPNYPVNWITGYNTVELLTKNNGEEIKAHGENETLTAEQRNIINALNMADNVVFNVWYKTKNSISDKVENRKMSVSMTVVPEVSAEYNGGYNQMIAYLKDNSISKISDKYSDKLQLITVFFTVNTSGKVEQVKLINSSTDTEIDALLVKLISEMPKWKPAKNVDGESINQKVRVYSWYEGWMLILYCNKG